MSARPAEREGCAAHRRPAPARVEVRRIGAARRRRQGAHHGLRGPGISEIEAPTARRGSSSCRSRQASAVRDPLRHAASRSGPLGRAHVEGADDRGPSTRAGSRGAGEPRPGRRVPDPVEAMVGRPRRRDGAVGRRRRHDQHAGPERDRHADRRPPAMRRANACRRGAARPRIGCAETRREGSEPVDRPGCRGRIDGREERRHRRRAIAGDRLEPAPDRVAQRGRDGPARGRRANGPAITAVASSSRSRPANGRSPWSASQNVTQKLNRSERSSAGSPRSCSGAM